LALPAVLEFWKSMKLLVMVALPPLMTIPAPVNTKFEVLLVKV
jgi:hypothetical protein